MTGEHGLQAGLWVNSDLWEQISDNKEEEGEHEKQILLEHSSSDER